MKALRFPALALAAMLALPAAAQTVTVASPNTVNPAGQPTAVGKTFIVNADGTIGSAGASGPSSAASAAIAPTTTSTETASSLVACASACNLFTFSGRSSVGGFFLITNTASAPADGAIVSTLLDCLEYSPGSGTLTYDTSGAPIRGSAGVTINFSVTGCTTKTASASAWIKAQAK